MQDLLGRPSTLDIQILVIYTHMAQSTADGRSGSTTECRIGNPATGDEAREYRMLALEAVLGATESQGIPRDRLVKIGMEGVER